MSNEGTGLWLLVSGPSGVGKSTLMERLLKEFHPQLQPVVTATTRAMRPGEENGKQYYFLSREEFENKKRAGEFLETTEQYGRGYGVLRAEVKEKLTLGKDLVMHVTWSGRQRLMALAQKEPWLQRAMVGVFLRPTSLEALRKRLEARGRNTNEEIEARLRSAEVDLAHAGEYEHVVQSGTLEEDFQRMREIYLQERGR